MFEKEAEEYYESKPVHTYVDSLGFFHDLEGIKQAYIQGRIDERKANEWHYVKDGDLPSDRHGHVVINQDWDKVTIRNGRFEHLDGGKADVIAWKEIVLPKEIENV